MTTWLRLTMAWPLLKHWFMGPTRATIVLVGVLLSGCFYPRPYGGYSPVYRSVPYYGSAPYYGSYGSGPYYGSGPFYGDRYRYGRRDWYYDRDYYDRSYRNRSARERAEDRARAQRQLRHDQRERRHILLHRQERQRAIRQSEGTWNRKNVHYQQQRRNRQDRFRGERQEQRKRRDHARD